MNSNHRLPVILQTLDMTTQCRDYIPESFKNCVYHVKHIHLNQRGTSGLEVTLINSIKLLCYQKDLAGEEGDTV